MIKFYGFGLRLSTRSGQDSEQNPSFIISYYGVLYSFNPVAKNKGKVHPFLGYFTFEIDHDKILLMTLNFSLYVLSNI